MKDYPLILVFYVAREVISQRQLMSTFVESVNMLIESKGVNAMAFFVPTDGEERIECINPVLVADTDMEKINKMVQDIAKSFDVPSPLNETE